MQNPPFPGDCVGNAISDYLANRHQSYAHLADEQGLTRSSAWFALIAARSSGRAKSIR